MASKVLSVQFLPKTDRSFALLYYRADMTWLLVIHSLNETDMDDKLRARYLTVNTVLRPGSIKIHVHNWSKRCKIVFHIRNIGCNSLPASPRPFFLYRCFFPIILAFFLIPFVNISQHTRYI